MKTTCRDACCIGGARRRLDRRGPGSYGTTTAAPRNRPRRRSSSASGACSSPYRVTVVRTGTRGASARNSSPSRRGGVDRKGVVEGKGDDVGGGPIHKKKKTYNT